MSSTSARGREEQSPHDRTRRRDPEGRMSFGAHLVELRNRFFVALIAVAVLSVGGWFVTPFILDALREPVTQLASAGRGGHVAELNFPNLTGAFDLRLQIAITVGIVAASPIWLYELWAFIVPALVRKERGYVIGFLGTAIPLFFAGCWFGWYILPHVVTILGSFVSHEDTSIVDAKSYYNFVIKLIVAVGIAFVLPVFLVLLNFAGVLSARAIISSWRIAIICILIFTAIVTPSADVVSMFVLAAPMVALYLIACVVAWFRDRAVAKRQAKLDEEYSA